MQCRQKSGGTIQSQGAVSALPYGVFMDGSIGPIDAFHTDTEYTTEYISSAPRLGGRLELLASAPE